MQNLCMKYNENLPETACIQNWPDNKKRIRVFAPIRLYHFSHFKILYPKHNLIRARCQLALYDDMMRKMVQMQEIVESIAQSVGGQL